MEVTGHKQREAWNRNVLPPVEQVRPGLWSIPVPIPINPLRYVLAYAFELPDGVALVDVGWDTPEAWEALNRGLAETGHEVADVRAILVTHVHPDHYGLAGRVREVSGAWIGMHELEAATIPKRYGDAIERLIDGSREWLRWCGAPERDAEALAGSSKDIRPFVHLAQPDRLLADGERLQLPGWSVEALWTPGHTPGHLCFYEREHRLLLSGDHVLPRISPNISAHPMQGPNPLGDFLRSLDRLSALAEQEVLPAHEYRFHGLADRVDELRSHHEARLYEIRSVLREHEELSTWEIAERLTWSRPWSEFSGFVRRAAVGETLAHLVLLESLGMIGKIETGGAARWTVRLVRCAA
ncbi:MAG TPA: MBL fold metallo-hydrolase [Micromonosporaceae bacterium]